MIALLSTCTELELPAHSGDTTAAVTAFICANCARAGHRPESAGLARPAPPRFAWPFPVREILVPCTGRIQPEHVLKAFELGADLICAVACEEDNCHYLEGSRRCARRVDHLRTILDEIGLGGERLLLFHLAGTAAEDTALGTGETPQPETDEARNLRIAAIRDEVTKALKDLSPNPLYTGPMAETADEAYQEVDMSNDDNEE